MLPQQPLLLLLLAALALSFAAKKESTATAFLFAPAHSATTARESGVSLLLFGQETGFRSFSSSFPSTRRHPKKKSIGGEPKKNHEPQVPTSSSSNEESGRHRLAETKRNNMSMFLAQDDENGSGFDALEFFMTKDESIRKLREVEDFFRKEPDGIMMEEQSGVVPSFATRKKKQIVAKAQQQHQPHPPTSTSTSTSSRSTSENNKQPSNGTTPDASTSTPAATRKNTERTILAESIKTNMARMTRDTGIGIDEERTSQKVVHYDGTLSKIKRNLHANPANYYDE